MSTDTDKGTAITVPDEILAAIDELIALGVFTDLSGAINRGLELICQLHGRELTDKRRKRLICDC